MAYISLPNVLYHQCFPDTGLHLRLNLVKRQHDRSGYCERALFVVQELHLKVVGQAVLKEISRIELILVKLWFHGKIHQDSILAQRVSCLLVLFYHVK